MSGIDGSMVMIVENMMNPGADNPTTREIPFKEFFDIVRKSSLDSRYNITEHHYHQHWVIYILLDTNDMYWQTEFDGFQWTYAISNLRGTVYLYDKGLFYDPLDAHVEAMTEISKIRRLNARKSLSR